MKKQNKKEDSIWGIIKIAVKDYLKSETNSPGGKANIICGLILAALLLAMQSSEIADFLGKLIKDDFDIGLPWYASLIMFIFTVLYFWYCAKSLMDIEKSRVKNSN